MTKRSIHNQTSFQGQGSALQCATCQFCRTLSKQYLVLWCLLLSEPAVRSILRNNSHLFMHNGFAAFEAEVLNKRLGELKRWAKSATNLSNSTLLLSVAAKSAMPSRLEMPQVESVMMLGLSLGHTQAVVCACLDARCTGFAKLAHALRCYLALFRPVLGAQISICLVLPTRRVQRRSAVKHDFARQRSQTLVGGCLFGIASGLQHRKVLFAAACRHVSRQA